MNRTPRRCAHRTAPKRNHSSVVRAALAALVAELERRRIQRANQGEGRPFS